MNSHSDEIKKENQIFCLDCKKYFKNMELFNEEHNKVLYQVLNKKHNFITEDKSLQYIGQFIKANDFLVDAIKEQQKQIKDLSKRLDMFEDSYKDIFFECNIEVKNGKEVIKNLGKCCLQFFPRCINFKIECKGDIKKNDKNKFSIDIVFPFRKANIKQCFIEKIQGCASTEEISDADGNNCTIFHNYTSYLEQKNSIISIKLLKNYCIEGKYEQKKINVVINGMLTFNSLIGNYNLPIILYNILEKKFLCYEEQQWKFIDHFIQDGKINEKCFVSLLIDDNNTVCIKGMHKYLGYKPNYNTSDEKEAKLDINFINKMYGLVEITKNGESLSMDENGNVTFGKEKIFYLICNI